MSKWHIFMDSLVLSFVFLYDKIRHLYVIANCFYISVAWNRIQWKELGPQRSKSKIEAENC